MKTFYLHAKINLVYPGSIPIQKEDPSFWIEEYVHLHWVEDPVALTTRSSFSLKVNKISVPNSLPLLFAWVYCNGTKSHYGAAMGQEHGIFQGNSPSDGPSPKHQIDSIDGVKDLGFVNLTGF